MHVEEQPMVYFNALNTIIALINYGGRITDNKDMELNKSLLSLFMNKNTLKGGQKYVPSLSYSSPESTKHAHALLHIETYPDQDSPAIFGLDQNAIINY